MSAELLAQKRAALGSPDSEQAAGHSSAEHSKAVSVGMAASGGSTIEGTAQKPSSGPSDSAAAASSTSAAAGAAHLRRAPATRTPTAARVDLREQQTDGRGKDASTLGSTLAFQQLSLTFKHGELLTWLLNPHAARICTP